MKLDAELSNMSWKIKWDDLVFKNIGKSMGASIRSLSMSIVRILLKGSCSDWGGGKGIICPGDLTQKLDPT